MCTEQFNNLKENYLNVLYSVNNTSERALAPGFNPFFFFFPLLMDAANINYSFSFYPASRETALHKGEEKEKEGKRKEKEVVFSSSFLLSHSRSLWLLHD